MVDPSIISEWLKKADEDLHFAELSLHDGSEFYAQICFHFQQARADRAWLRNGSLLCNGLFLWLISSVESGIIPEIYSI